MTRCQSLKGPSMARRVGENDGSPQPWGFNPYHYTFPSSAPKGRRNVARGQERHRRDDPGLRKDKKSKPRGGDGSGPGREPGGPPPAAGLAPLARPSPLRGSGDSWFSPTPG